AEAVAARPFLDEQVLEIEARLARPGRVVVKVQREAGRLAVDLGNQRLEARMLAAAVPAQILGGRFDRMRLVLVQPPAPDQGQQGLGVVLTGFSGAIEPARAYADGGHFSL